MEALVGILFFIIGTVIGSFLNVVIFRYNTGLSIQKGRSQCFSCGKKLHWYELIPLFSFIFLRGKCQECKSTISKQYPLVELGTGLIFLGVGLKLLPLFVESITVFLVTSFFTLLFFCVYIIIFVYDLRHKIIPDGLSALAAGVSFIALFITFYPLLSFRVPTLYEFLAGPILAAPFAALWLISSGRWMGLGDAKLAVSIGWFLGLAYGISAIVIAFWIGALVGVTLIVLDKTKPRFIHKMLLFIGIKNLTIKSELPFAPFLIIGVVIVYFMGIDVVGLSQLLP